MMKQGTYEWFSARLGKVTASNVDNVIVKVKNGESVYKRKYRTQLITEILTGKPINIFVNEAMKWGTDHEDEARNFYMEKRGLLKDIDVKEVGFIDHSTVKMSGASPDGLVGKDGLIEIKCPQPMTHTDFLISKRINKKHIHQMQWQMACTGKKWCDYVCYHPDFPAAQKMLVIRVERDNDLINRLEKDIQDFVTEVEDSVKFIQENNQWQQ